MDKINKKIYDCQRWKTMTPEQRKEHIKWWKDNPKKVREISKRFYKKLRLKVLTHYCNGTPKCECCGETIIEFLTMDHINGGGNKHRKEIGRGNLYCWLKKNNYPKEYRVLCMNCNWARRYNGVCPHKKGLKILK